MDKLVESSDSDVREVVSCKQVWAESNESLSLFDITIGPSTDKGLRAKD